MYLGVWGVGGAFHTTPIRNPSRVREATMGRYQPGGPLVNPCARTVLDHLPHGFLRILGSIGIWYPKGWHRHWSIYPLDYPPEGRQPHCGSLVATPCLLVKNPVPSATSLIHTLADPGKINVAATNSYTESPVITISIYPLIIKHDRGNTLQMMIHWGFLIRNITYFYGPLSSQPSLISG